MCTYARLASDAEAAENRTLKELNDCGLIWLVQSDILVRQTKPLADDFAWKIVQLIALAPKTDFKYQRTKRTQKYYSNK